MIPAGSGFAAEDASVEGALLRECTSIGSEAGSLEP